MGGGLTATAFVTDIGIAYLTYGLGVGIGALSGKAFRIAHMGHVNAPMVLGTLGVVETGLAALGIPHGRGGVQAAIAWLAENVSP